jgi:hypothetical protein
MHIKARRPVTTTAYHHRLETLKKATNHAHIAVRCPLKIVSDMGLSLRMERNHRIVTAWKRRSSM